MKESLAYGAEREQIYDAQSRSQTIDIWDFALCSLMSGRPRNFENRDSQVRMLKNTLIGKAGCASVNLSLYEATAQRQAPSTSFVF